MLVLDGLTSIDSAAAEALAKFSGRQLFMGQVEATLASIGGPVPLSQASARLVSAVSVLERHLAREPGKPGDGEVNDRRIFTAAGIALRGVTSFEMPDAVEIARILATSKAPLALPHLKRISSRTLSALLEREDISIPRIESLQLIPEPDGSPAEDVGYQVGGGQERWSIAVSVPLTGLLLLAVDFVQRRSASHFCDSRAVCIAPRTRTSCPLMS